MSRTVKGSKWHGYEYWSARPFNHLGYSPSAYCKKRTHKAERQLNKKDIE